MFSGPWEPQGGSGAPWLEVLGPARSVLVLGPARSVLLLEAVKESRKVIIGMKLQP